MLKWIRKKIKNFKKFLERRILFELALVGVGYILIVKMMLILGNLTFGDLMAQYNRHMGNNSFSFSQDIIKNIFVLFDLCIITPIVEELIFRRFIMKKLQKRLNFNLSNILQSVIFAVCHLNIVQALYAFPIGMMNGHLNKKYKTLYAGIVIHAAANFVGTVWPAIENEIIMSYISNDIALVIIEVLVSGIGIWLFFKAYKRVNVMSTTCNS